MRCNPPGEGKGQVSNNCVNVLIGGLADTGRTHINTSLFVWDTHRSLETPPCRPINWNAVLQKFGRPCEWSWWKRGNATSSTVVVDQPTICVEDRLSQQLFYLYQLVSVGKICLGAAPDNHRLVNEGMKPMDKKPIENILLH